MNKLTLHILRIIYCLISSSTIFAYNLDLQSFIRHGGSPGSMFGFSIALHRHNTNWVIVGAPKTNTTSYQPGIESAGAVYKCDIQDDNRCLLVPFDSKGNQYNDRGEQIDTKSNQWLGAAVSSGGENGPIVACAPRYVFHTMQPTKVERIEPVGTCFTSSKNFTQFTEYSPCRTNYWGYHRQGSCQAGFSAAISKRGDRLFIGAPGSWYWQGQVYSIHTDAKLPYKPQFYQDFGTGGQINSYDITDRRNNVYATGESFSSDDDSYLGYSMITGDFNGDGEEDVAVGMPRGNGLVGKVVIFKWDVANQINMTGQQIGAYFGYSLCSVDVDGDKLDDLIIGAPMYTTPNNDGKYDVGRVYIMLQGRNALFERTLTRDGVNSRGRFGLALTTLGDINQDNYGDFAVGAPYDGEFGRGAVYIYHGSPNGPLEKHSQVIYAENVVGQPYPRTFGFSLAGGMDMDGNLYPDMAVGAYLSDSVIVFKARPVAVVDASTTFSGSSKLLNLDEKTCMTSRAKKLTCTEIKSCLKYNGNNLPHALDFEVSWVLDSRKLKMPRMFFLTDESKNVRNSTIRLERGKILCKTEKVYVIDDIKDKLTPLEVEMRYQLRGSKAKQTIRRKRELEPVIDQNREIVQRDSINVQKNCGSDNICIPDLRLSVHSVDKFLFGSTDPLEIEVNIENFGEDAFEAGFYMNMPPDLHYNKIQQIGDSYDTPITCSVPTISNNYTLKCDVGNPLQAGRNAKFNVIMMPSQKPKMAASYEFLIEANSTNVEVNSSRFDNIIRKSISLWIETALAVEGSSYRPTYEHYKASDYKSFQNATHENDLGPEVVHNYNILNNGVSLIEEVVVFVHWPYKTNNGETLMYLLNQPETDGNIVCEPSIFVNPRNLILDAALTRKSYLEAINAKEGSIGGSQMYHSSTNTIIDQSRTNQQSHTYQGQGTADRVFTETEQRKLAEEDNVESAGDASFKHIERSKDTANAGLYHGNIGGGGYRTETSSWNSSTYGGSPIVVTSSRNRTITYDQHGNENVVESSTQYYRNIDQGQHLHMNPSQSINTNSEQQHSRGYQQSGSSSYENQNRGQGYHSTDNVYGGRSQNQFDDYSANSKVNLNKMAQGGHGLQTGLLDIGTMHRSNVDTELRNQGSIQGQSQGGNTYSSQSSGGGHYGTSRIEYPQQIHRTGGYESSSSGRQNQFYNGHDQYDGLGKDFEYVDHGGNDENYHHASSNSYQSHSANHDSSRHHGGSGGGQSSHYEQRNYLRSKRDIGSKVLELESPCLQVKCETLRCVVSNLDKNEDAWISIRTRVVAETMKELSQFKPLNISTMAVAHVTRLPNIGSPKDSIVKRREIFYVATPDPPSHGLPLWVVVLSAVAGAIILLLLVFLLYKCGFFKRNRPSHVSQERQPLRNGYHGDEHL